ncbi:MAG: hypothetical protein IH989_03245 [Planctomycetes bacterium]|nr:hypothetical protein [Planctomycetota bacterium]
MADGSMEAPINDSPDRILSEIEQEERALQNLNQNLYRVPKDPWEKLPRPPTELDVMATELVKGSRATEMRTNLFRRAAILRGTCPDLPPIPPYTDDRVYDVTVALRNWCVDASLVRNRAQDPQDTRSHDSTRVSHASNLSDTPDVEPATPSDKSEISSAAHTVSRLREKDPEAPSGQEPKDARVPVPNSRPARHGPDFRSVHWYDIDYHFTGMQAAVVKVLWESLENGTPDVGDAKLLSLAGGSGDRLRDVFKDHPAWGTMIVDGKTKGSKRLCEPTGN